MRYLTAGLTHLQRTQLRLKVSGVSKAPPQLPFSVADTDGFCHVFNLTCTESSVFREAAVTQSVHVSSQFH